jgi:hypothetical protein
MGGIPHVYFKGDSHVGGTPPSMKKDFFRGVNTRSIDRHRPIGFTRR